MQQRPAEGRRLVKLPRLHPHRPLRQRQQRGVVEGEGLLEVDLLQGKQTVALRSERAAIGLTIMPLTVTTTMSRGGARSSAARTGKAKVIEGQQARHVVSFVMPAEAGIQ